MRLKFEIETHHDKAGNWVAQILLGNYVVHEETGPVSESQAIDNVVCAFASTLASVIEDQQAALVETVDE